MVPPQVRYEWTRTWHPPQSHRTSGSVRLGGRTSWTVLTGPSRSTRATVLVRHLFQSYGRSYGRSSLHSVHPVSSSHLFTSVFQPKPSPVFRLCPSSSALSLSQLSAGCLVHALMAALKLMLSEATRKPHQSAEPDGSEKAGERCFGTQ